MSELLEEGTRELVSPALIAYKRKNYNINSTSEEQELLASLLTDHDHAVRNFKSQTQRLQEVAPEACNSLFKYIGTLNELVESTEDSGSSH